MKFKKLTRVDKPIGTSVSISVETHKQIKSIAQATGYTIGQVTTMLLEEALKNVEVEGE